MKTNSKMKKAPKERRGQRSAVPRAGPLQRPKILARANTTAVSKVKRPKGRAPRRPLESTAVLRLKTVHSQNFLRARLAEAEETLRAIRNGEVDRMVGTGKNNRQVFTLAGAGAAVDEADGERVLRVSPRNPS